MSLSVGVARVRERCGLETFDHDAAIQSLINETLPAIEYAVRPEHVADTANSGLQHTLNLAALEIVSGEFFAQLCRMPGFAEAVVVSGLEIRPFVGSDARDPSGLIAQGWTRIRPFLRSDPSMPAKAPIGLAGRKVEEEP